MQAIHRGDRLTTITLVVLNAPRYQSGGVDYDGQISRRGDTYARSLLDEAAVVTLTRSWAPLREPIGSLAPDNWPCRVEEDASSAGDPAQRIPR